MKPSAILPALFRIGHIFSLAQTHPILFPYPASDSPQKKPVRETGIIYKPLRKEKFSRTLFTCYGMARMPQLPLSSVLNKHAHA